MKKTLSIYYVITLFFLLGFYTHTSYLPDILFYSKKYFIFLVVISVFFLLLIPYLLSRFLKKYTRRELAFAMIPTVALLAIIYTAGNIYYYNNQLHLFDPFLQVPPSTYYYETAKDTNTVRILCLGGSTTRFVMADSLDRYPTILQQILDKRNDGKKYEVLNAGMDWYTSKHSLINYAAYCRNFKADKVIVMHAINDIYRSFSPPGFSIGAYESDYSHFYGPSIYGARPESFSQKIYKKFRQIWFSQNISPRDFEMDEFVSKPDFEDYLSQLVELIQQDGAEAFLVSQGHMYRKDLSRLEESKIWMSRTFCEKNNEFPNIQSLANAMDTYNSSTKDIAKKYNIPLIDAEPILKKDLEHFVDDVHYTTMGSTKLAQFISRYILK